MGMGVGEEAVFWPVKKTKNRPCFVQQAAVWQMFLKAGLFMASPTLKNYCKSG